jgi:hypothetical protein
MEESEFSIQNYKKEIIVIAIIAVILLLLIIYTPNILQFIFKDEKIIISKLDYSHQAYRPNGLDINFTLENSGTLDKELYINIRSKDSDIDKTYWIKASESNQTTITLPVSSLGERGFTVYVYWNGPLGISKILQTCQEGIFTVFGSDYEVTSTQTYADIGTNLSYKVMIKNLGNILIDKLEIKVIEKGEYSTINDYATINDFNEDDEREVVFKFTIPSTINENTKTTIKFQLISNYKGVQETTEKELYLNNQKSAKAVESENIIYWAGLIGATITAVVILANKLGIQTKRRR